MQSRRLASKWTPPASRTTLNGVAEIFERRLVRASMHASDQTGARLHRPDDRPPDRRPRRAPDQSSAAAMRRWSACSRNLFPEAAGLQRPTNGGGGMIGEFDIGGVFTPTLLVWAALAFAHRHARCVWVLNPPRRLPLRLAPGPVRHRPSNPPLDRRLRHSRRPHLPDLRSMKPIPLPIRMLFTLDPGGRRSRGRALDVDPLSG